MTIRETFRPHLVRIALWTTLAFGWDVFRYDLFGTFWILAMFIPSPLWMGFVQAFRTKKWAVSANLLVLLSAVGGVQYLKGDSIGRLTRFYAWKPFYRAAVDARDAGDPLPTRFEVKVDESPGCRLAFPWPGGILDKWCGVVYDPTGVVLQANGLKRDWSNSDDPAIRQARGLFGGDLYRCEPLGGDWYFCWFT